MSKVRICATQDLELISSRGFTVQGLSLFVIRKDGSFYVYRNSCPHRGVELNWNPDQFLDIDEQLIQCSTHGALFLIADGRCVGGPCQGEYLQALPFEINDHIIYLDTDSPLAPQAASADV